MINVSISILMKVNNLYILFAICFYNKEIIKMFNINKYPSTLI